MGDWWSKTGNGGQKHMVMVKKWVMVVKKWAIVVKTVWWWSKACGGGQKMGNVGGKCVVMVWLV